MDIEKFRKQLNLNHQEIAEIAGISEPTVREKISRLKDQFKQQHP